MNTSRTQRSEKSEFYVPSEGFDHRAGHFRPPGMVEGIAKPPVLQGLRCFYLGPSFAGVAGAMIKAPVSDPYILPPVFNKMSSDSPGSMWERALGHLRKAKKIVIVGYSLPQTDIYMQYFLKAGVGPNVFLRRIFVFDPLLFSEKDTKAAKAMKKRYESCFATQLRKHICFNPDSCIRERMAPAHFGTTHHFVTQIMGDPDSIFF